ncbi:MAG: DUF3108 domain-containing protein [Nevskiales bacterium]
MNPSRRNASLSSQLKISAAAIMLGLGLPASADVLSPYTAVYEVNRGNIMLGDTTFNLNKQDGGCYLLEGVAEPKGIAAMFAGKMKESSHFCLENGRIRPRQYHVEKEKGDEDDNYTLKFDWGNKLVRTNNDKPRELPTDGLDRTVMEIAMRRLLAQAGNDLPSSPFIFLMVEDDEIKPYRFQITGQEKVATPVGRFDTVKVERVNAGKREFRLWLAPALDYLPVKVERQKKGDDPIRMTLRELPKSPASQ